MSQKHNIASNLKTSVHQAALPEQPASGLRRSACQTAARMLLAVAGWLDTQSVTPACPVCALRRRVSSKFAAPKPLRAVDLRHQERAFKYRWKAEEPQDRQKKTK